MLVMEGESLPLHSGQFLLLVCSVTLSTLSTGSYFRVHVTSSPCYNITYTKDLIYKNTYSLRGREKIGIILLVSIVNSLGPTFLKW